MTGSLVRTTLAALAVLAAAGSASAQEPAQARPGLRIHLLPSIGREYGEIIGAVAGGGLPEGNAAVQHHATTTLGLAVEATTPVRWLDLRLGVSYARPRANLEPFGDSDVYRTSVKTATLDAVLRGPRLLDARTYALVCGGVRHHDFKQSYFEDSNELPVRDELLPVLHLGAGVSWNVGRYDLFAEGGAHLTRQFEQDTEAAFADRRASPGYFTVGARIPIH